MMKRTNRNRMAIALLSATALFALAACDKASDGILPGAPVQSLTIDTHVNGYVPEGAAADTRASTSGNTFSFTSGDAIGLIALKNGSVMSQYNNVKLTYGGGGSWRSSTKIYDFGATGYIAYYPYRSDMAGKTSVDAIKSAFPIQNDQSTEANFNASNLLTATATLSGSTLRFNFTPAFAMVEVTVPDDVKATASIDGKSYVYRIYGTTSSSAAYTCATPLFRKDKTLRRIIKPGTATEMKITCGVDNVPCVTYTKNVNIGAGNYKKLVLKGTMTRNLAIGDLVYNDGGTIAFFPGSATAVPTSNCLGAIWALGQRSGDSPSNYDGKLSAVHGYVVALKQSLQGKFASQNVTIWTPGEVTDPVTGYITTKKIKSMSGYSAATFPVCWYSSNWTPSAPSSTSGWYLPARNEYESMFSNSGIIGTGLSKVGGNYLPELATVWTCTEGINGKISIYYHLHGYNQMDYNEKTYQASTIFIWPCFTF